MSSDTTSDLENVDDDALDADPEPEVDVDVDDNPIVDQTEDTELDEAADTELDDDLGFDEDGAEPADAERPDPMTAPTDTTPLVMPRDRRGSRRVDSYLKRQERQRVRDEKWSRRYRKRRHRILPRTILGMTLLLVALAVGAAFAATVLYTWFDFRLKETQENVEVFTTDFEDRFNEASAQIEAQREAATQEINESIAVLEELTEESALIVELPAEIQESVFFVETLDEDGRSSPGTAFVVGTSSSETFLLTSYEVVRSSIRGPSPTIGLRATDRVIEARLQNYDEELDMAVLVIDEGDLPVINWAPPAVAADPRGRRVYAAAGLGAQGAAISGGYAVDASAAGVQHTAAVGTSFRGGPLLTSEGEVIGMATLNYAPLGWLPGDVPFTPNIISACDRLLNCSGSIPQAVDQGAEGGEDTANSEDGQDGDEPDEDQ